MKAKLLVAVFTTVIATAALYASDSPPVGSEAPNFSATDSHGKTVSLADFKGKYVVLEWFNPECPFVKKHYGSGNMQKLQKNFTDKGVAWLTIDSNAPDKEGNLTPAQANKKIAEWKCAFHGVPARFRRQGRQRVWRQEHAAHVRHQSGRQDHLRRRD